MAATRRNYLKIYKLIPTEIELVRSDLGTLNKYQASTGTYQNQQVKSNEPIVVANCPAAKSKTLKTQA
jgi:hypothetical protein